MKEVLDDLDDGKYQRIMVKNNSLEDNEEGKEVVPS
jgi:hypothetical protein